MEIFKIEASLKNGTVANYDRYTEVKDVELSVPDEGEFYQIMHDAERMGFPRQKFTSYPNREIPATMMEWLFRKLPTSDFIPVLKSWQERTYELFRLVVGNIPSDGKITGWWINDPKIAGKKVMVPKGTPHSFPEFEEGSLKEAYQKFISNHVALTDNWAYNTEEFWGRDFVCNMNSDSAENWRIKGLSFTGNIHKKIYPQPFIQDARYIAVEAFDYSQPAPSLEWILSNKPYLIHWTTNQGGMNRELTPIAEKRRFTVSRWPHLKVVCRKYGLPEVGTPFFAIGKDGYNLIEKDVLKKVSNGASYSPYVSEK